MWIIDEGGGGLMGAYEKELVALYKGFRFPHPCWDTNFKCQNQNPGSEQSKPGTTMYLYILTNGLADLDEKAFLWAKFKKECAPKDVRRVENRHMPF